MSTTRESKPWWAITSAEKLLGMDSHPFTTTSPRAQIDLTVFSRTSFSFFENSGPRAPSPFPHRGEELVPQPVEGPGAPPVDGVAGLGHAGQPGAGKEGGQGR